MEKNKRSEKLIYPYFILAIVLVCAALILFELWTNVSAVLTDAELGAIEELAAGITGFFQQIKARFDPSLSPSDPTSGVMLQSILSERIHLLETWHAA